MTRDRYVYETEFVPKDRRLTLKGIVVHMEADSYAEAERESWLVFKTFVRETAQELFEVRHCQAIRQVHRSQEKGM